MTIDIDLKRCAHCDGEAELQYKGGRSSNAYAVWCKDCNIGTAWSSTREPVVEEWNLRASIPPSTGDSVPIPQNADQAQLMANLGLMWLKDHAPERLTDAGRGRSISKADGEAPSTEWISAKILSYTRPESPRDHESAQRCARVIRTAFEQAAPAMKDKP